MMNLIKLESVGSVFNTSDNQVYPQLVNGLPDLDMGVDMYDVSMEWISFFRVWSLMWRFTS